MSTLQSYAHQQLAGAPPFSAAACSHGRQGLRELGVVPTDAAACDFPEANVPHLAATIRSHWCCERRNWAGDTPWQEDGCLFCDPNAAGALALIRTGIQALLARLARRSLPRVFEDASHRPALGLTWLHQRHVHR